MGMSLAEYAALHPQPQPEQERREMEKTARTYAERQEERAEVERLKAGIWQQLEQGAAPQYILYAALKAIGILTHDPEFAQAGQKALDNVYADLAQQSFLVDNAAIAAARLENMQANYNSKLRQQLKRNLNGYRRIERALTEALQAVDALEPQEPKAEGDLRQSGGGYCAPF